MQKEKPKSSINGGLNLKGDSSDLVAIAEQARQLSTIVKHESEKNEAELVDLIEAVKELALKTVFASLEAEVKIRQIQFDSKGGPQFALEKVDNSQSPGAIDDDSNESGKSFVSSHILTRTYEQLNIQLSRLSELSTFE